VKGKALSHEEEHSNEAMPGKFDETWMVPFFDALVVKWNTAALPTLNVNDDGTVMLKSTSDTFTHDRTREDCAHTKQSDEIFPNKTVRERPAGTATKSFLTHDVRLYVSELVPLFSTITDKAFPSSKGVSLTEYTFVEMTTTTEDSLRIPSEEVSKSVNEYEPGTVGATTENDKDVLLLGGTRIDVGRVDEKFAIDGMNVACSALMLDKFNMNRALSPGPTETDGGETEAWIRFSIFRDTKNVRLTRMSTKSGWDAATVKTCDPLVTFSNKNIPPVTKSDFFT
jgi:hypothetical protein